MSRLAGVAVFVVLATLYVRSFAIPWRRTHIARFVDSLPTLLFLGASRLATGHAAVAAATNVLVRFPTSVDP